MIANSFEKKVGTTKTTICRRIDTLFSTGYHLSSLFSTFDFLSTNFFSVPYTGQMSRWSSNELSDLQTTRNLQYGHSLMLYEQSAEQSGSLSLSSCSLAVPLAICIALDSRSFSQLSREILDMGDELLSRDSCSENFRIRNWGTWFTSITFRFVTLSVESLISGEWADLWGDLKTCGDFVSSLRDLAAEVASIGLLFSSLFSRLERRDRSGKE